MAIDKYAAVYRKAAHYCSYQERTEQEVRARLRAWGIANRENEAYIIQVLKENHFLDETRYVETFIRGKFWGKRWGKRKLMAALAKNGINEALIQTGLNTIESADYLKILHDVALQKYQTLTTVYPIQREQKLANYLLQKGYEPDLVHQTVRTLMEQTHR
mmetsp:Transcript_26439/g.61538  ORF Transcript_26439/g.61538 Transcript_26439/m.61538 type:complete len:160 (-) Transcript_26439:496-975(-)